jgi:hypothetical protein
MQYSPLFAQRRASARWNPAAFPRWLVLVSSPCTTPLQALSLAIHCEYHVYTHYPQLNKEANY